MKMFKKFMAVAAACAAIALTACSSSNDEPVAEGVEESFFSSLLTGSKAETYIQTDYKIYEMDYEPYVAGSDDWSDFEAVWGHRYYGYGTPFICYKGTFHAPLPKCNDRLIPNDVNLINEPWRLYCELTGYDKEVYIDCDAKLSLPDNTLTICGYTFDINKATSNNLVLSTVRISYRPNADEWEPASAVKYVLSYIKHETSRSDLEKIAFLGIEKDARLTMVKMMRDYFGDVLDWSLYEPASDRPDINLLLMEDDIRNDRYDDYSYLRYTYPDRYSDD